MNSTAGKRLLIVILLLFLLYILYVTSGLFWIAMVFVLAVFNGAVPAAIGFTGGVILPEKGSILGGLFAGVYFMIILIFTNYIDRVYQSITGREAYLIVSPDVEMVLIMVFSFILYGVCGAIGGEWGSRLRKRNAPEKG